MAQIIQKTKYHAISVIKKVGENLIGLSFLPGEIEELTSFAPELVKEVEALWTAEVLKNWREYKKNQKEISDSENIETPEINGYLQQKVANIKETVLIHEKILDEMLPPVEPEEEVDEQPQ